MNKVYKQVYEAPQVELIQIKQTLDILAGGSGSGTVEDSDWSDGDWGDTGGIDWGNHIGAW